MGRPAHTVAAMIALSEEHVFCEAHLTLHLLTTRCPDCVTGEGSCEGPQATGRCACPRAPKLPAPRRS